MDVDPSGDPVDDGTEVKDLLAGKLYIYSQLPSGQEAVPWWAQPAEADSGDEEDDDVADFVPPQYAAVRAKALEALAAPLCKAEEVLVHNESGIIALPDGGRVTGSQLVAWRQHEGGYWPVRLRQAKLGANIADKDVGCLYWGTLSNNLRAKLNGKPKKGKEAVEAED